MSRRFAIVVAAALVSVPALAQDIGSALDPTTMIGYAGVAAANDDAKRYYGARGSASSSDPMISRRAFTQPARAGTVSNESYPAPSPQFRKQAVSDFVGRARHHDAHTADLISAELAQHDYGPIYDGITRPYGLSGNDASKSLAAYLVLGWMIVHDGKEPSAAGLQGVRAQAAQALSDPRLTDPGIRAKLGEEFKILFVTIHAGWQSARREGSLDRYADGVQKLFQQQNGFDLRTMRIGPAGFQPS